MSEHTKGPWCTGCFVNPDTKCQCKGIQSEGYAGGIATIHVDNGIKLITEGANDCPPLNEAIANAHLIASAPDLIELHLAEQSFLKFLLMAINEGDPISEIRLRVEDLQRAKDNLISKAKGERNE